MSLLSIVDATYMLPAYDTVLVGDSRAELNGMRWESGDKLEACGFHLSRIKRIYEM